MLGLDRHAQGAVWTRVARLDGGGARWDTSACPDCVADVETCVEGAPRSASDTDSSSNAAEKGGEKGVEKISDKQLAALATSWWTARPATRFVDWDPTRRSAIEAQARALGAIPEGSTKSVIDALWAPSKKLGPHGKVSGDKLTIDTPYGPAWCALATAKKGSPLVIGLHGGGEDSGSADESRSTWARKGAVGMYPQGIRLVHDTWNTVHGERFVLSLIEIAKVQYDVDPDHVYVMGFSMGGTGSWFLAGRHPDWFAGAAPFSGVLMAAPRSQVKTKAEVASIQHGLVPNVRNLAMYYTIGLEDPRTMPGTYLFVADVLDNLRKSDPKGWSKIHFQTFPDLVHEFPPGEPEGAFKSLFAQARDVFPTDVVWEYAREYSPEPGPDDHVTRLDKTRFYWLGCSKPNERQWIRAQRDKNQITLTCRNTSDGAKGITIYLNASMIDVTNDVVVKMGETELYRGKPVPDAWTVLETLDDMLDRSMVFDRRIEL